MTKQEHLLRMLELNEEGMTGMDFIKSGCGVDYRKRISELRAKGYNIEDKWEKSGRDHFKRYKLV